VMVASLIAARSIGDYWMRRSHGGPLLLVSLGCLFAAIGVIAPGPLSDYARSARAPAGDTMKLVVLPLMFILWLWSKTVWLCLPCGTILVLRGLQLLWARRSESRAGPTGQ
jgi:hypothetical protein